VVYDNSGGPEYFDPSYGYRYPSLQEWENGCLSGFLGVKTVITPPNTAVTTFKIYENTAELQTKAALGKPMQ
jgi:hypothetical protein